MFKAPPLGPPDVTGDLQRFPVPRLLFFLLKKAFLGTVTFKSSIAAGRIYFRDGMPVFTDIASTRDVLGRVLLERGTISEDAYNRSLQELARTGQLQGQILVGLGALDRRTLVEGLRLQLHRKLNRLFPVLEAEIGIHAGEHGVGQDEEGSLVQADPLRVVYHGVRNCYDADRMALELDRLHGQVVHLRPGFERRQARYGMSEEEAALTSFLSTRTVSIENLLRVSHLSPLQTLMVVYTLWVTEALTAAPDPAAAARAANPRPSRSSEPVAPLQPRQTRGSEPVAPLQPRQTRGSEPVAPIVTQAPPRSTPPPAELTPPPMQVPGFEDLARSFDTSLVNAAIRRSASQEIGIIPLSQEMAPASPGLKPQPSSPGLAPRASSPGLSPRASSPGLSPRASSPGLSPDLEPIQIDSPPEPGGAVITPPPPPELGSPFITPPPPPELGSPFITPPPPAELGSPFITPPPAEHGSPFITPPPAEHGSPFITPPPPPEQGSAFITPPPPELLDESEPASIEPPAPELASIRLPGSDQTEPSPEAGSFPRLDPPSATVAGRKPRPSQQVSPSSAQVVMEHKSLLRKAQERMKGQSHYQVLEVPREATVDQVREAYFRLAKIYHPDRCAALSLFDMSPVAEEIFRRINEAHAALTDAEARKAYDEDLEGGGADKKAAMAALEAEFAFQKGVIFFRKKNFSEARACFDQCCKLNDKEGEHLAWLAWTDFNDPRTDKAKILPRVKEQLLKAIKISPQNPVCHYYLGEVYLALRDESRARTCFTRTVELQESHVEANRHLRLMTMRRDKQTKKDKGLFGGLLKKK